MEKDIKDYLPFYMGQMITTHHNFRPNGKESVNKTGYAKLTGDMLADIENKTFPFTPKLVLRPLWDMTEEEKKQIDFFKEIMLDIKPQDTDMFIMCAKISQELLKQGFDLFGLIDAGLAIDKTTLK